MNRNTFFKTLAALASLSGIRAVAQTLCVSKDANVCEKMASADVALRQGLKPVVQARRSLETASATATSPITANKTCPVCKTAAPAILHYRRAAGECPEDRARVQQFIRCNDDKTVEISFSQMVRCAKCSNAFFQDSEHDSSIK